jgi:integrase/recombinase XerD
MSPQMLRHPFVTATLRDVQIAARHDRARKNLDRHPNYILAAFMASGT